MKILVDADACPVKDIIEKVAKKYHLELILVSNINHLIDSAYGEVVVVDGLSQAADMAIINRTVTGDIVITQDYGLASIALAKGGLALHPVGKQFTEDNIDGLLMQRYINDKVRRAGGRIHGPQKRNAADNSLFEERLSAIINNYVSERKSL
jgi:hypothetical protein